MMTENPQPQRRKLPPDARIILPTDQPQRIDRMVARPEIRSRSGAMPPIGSGWGMAIRELVETILPAVFVALLIHLFLAQATRVEGYSMEPTLFGHQRLVVEKLSYRFHSPDRGDIVVLRMPGFGREMLIKRVIAIAGETVEVKDGQVYINGQALSEDYLNLSPRGSYAAQEVPEGHVFVMGDNRNNSNDSRSFGPIPIESIVGRAWIRYWPILDMGLLE